MSYRRKNKYHYKEEKRTHIVFSSDPLSLTGPAPTDLTNEKLLENVLREANRLKEHRQQAQEREYVLQDLDQICQEWVKTSARKHNHPEEFVSNSKVRLFAFGSYKLDVHSAGDDVDLLCVGPNFLTRDMFFDELGVILQQNSCIRNFYAVRNAYVPVMSFKYNNIDIDIVYAQLQIELLDMEWDINDDRNLRNLDQTSILSLNGVRLAHKTLDLVPNKKVFRLSLRAIRYWAKQRGIYSNKLGYLGGVSWAILIGRVCQLYPNANSSQIVQNFFLFYHIWNFGTPLKAITLCNIVQHEDMPSIKVWDPNDQQSKYELMHIITPAFPAMNSTHNVSMSTFEVLKREIARAFHMLSRAKREIDEIKWKELLSRNTFFIDHKNYIFIKACAPYKNLTEWSGLIESKIRSFVLSLEQYPDVKVTPFCKAIKLKLKQAEINKHTHPIILKQIEIKRKEKIKKQKQKKLQLRRRKIEAQNLRKLQLKLQKERELERMQKELEIAKQNEKMQKIKEKMEIDHDDDTESTEQSIIKTEPETSTSQSQSPKPNHTNTNTNNNTEEEEKTPIQSFTTSPTNTNTNTPEHKPLKPTLQDDDSVVIVSNLSLPVPIEPKSPSLNSEKNDKKSTTTPVIVTSTVIPPSKPSNPYIYVAPELQRKYTFKGRNRRGQFYNRRNRFYGNRTYNITSASHPLSTNGSASPALTSISSKNGSESKENDTSLDISSVVSAPIMTSTMMGNSHAFLVGKNEIACCESFNNKILKEKAEKNNGYECRAFVIGVKVMHRILSIDTTADGERVEQVSRFDFSRSVVNFLKGLNHIYTDSHLIIQLISCNKVPHFLFPQYQNRRPDKAFIRTHQTQMDECHITWRSKSCLATLNEEKKKVLSSPCSSSNTPSHTPVVVGKNGVSKTPQFDKDDILMNDDSMDCMPGLGLPPAAQITATVATVATVDVDINESCEEVVKVRKLKRKVDELVVLDMPTPFEPAVKKRKLTITNGHVDVVGDGDSVMNGTIVRITEVNINKPVIEINYSNPYFEKINWDKKFDNSPTFEYAVKLYRKSQNFSSWTAVSHSLTATATHVYNTCNDQLWKSKLKKVLSNRKYGWNGCKYQIQLNKKLMFDLAHDIAYNYIQHKNEKKRKRKF